ncbi:MULTISPECIES: hypothetical protein [unclassified Streptomyces]|uniref:hypothetical protein n=1 Tax=unclassified Streptomyces TaxID=2593676 RepID=UPI002E2282FD|nr:MULTISPECIES: hypothetical protein [unclassified Streptomyces]MCX5049556.1 hypothetical protein [Streptomyces sp. NBC_00474]
MSASAKLAPLRKAPVALPATVPWKDGRKDTRQFLTDTHTNAFLVLRDGHLATSGTATASTPRPVTGPGPPRSP